MEIKLRPKLTIIACVGIVVGAGILIQISDIGANISRSEIRSSSLADPESDLPAHNGAVQPTSQLNPNNSTEKTETEAKAKETITRSFTVRKGDTLSGVLSRAGVNSNTSQSIINALDDVFEPRELKTEQEIRLVYTGDWQKTDPIRLAFNLSPIHEVFAARNSDGTFEAKEKIIETKSELVRHEGHIELSLFDAANRKGVPNSVLVNMSRLFSYDVDFQRDIRKGDGFEIMFTRRLTNTGKIIENGQIEYASMTLRGKKLSIYAYDKVDGAVVYYNASGEGIRKALMRTPIDGARLSSKFGKRRHPILGYTKMHRGVDFAAAKGTPIYAAGDGVVMKKETAGGYGKYISIKHGGSFSTAYAHMNKYARGLKVGARVKQGQVIGYVGSTGQATGPHLHYEVHEGGQQVNPMKVSVPTTKTLLGQDLAMFISYRQDIDNQYKETAERESASILAEQSLDALTR